MQIDGKAALITGAASGIGRAIAITFAAQGARHLTLCDIDDHGLAETAAMAEKLGTIVTQRHLDVADYRDCERALEETNSSEGLDIVINNAGIVAGLPEYPHTALE